MRPGLTLARFVLLEARRTGLPWLVVSALAGGFGLAGFLSQLALTESASLECSILAAGFRLIAVLLVSAFVVTSMVRESADKGTDLLLSMPISRTEYFLGKLAGFAACGALLSFSFALTMLFWSPIIPVLAWFSSLVIELAVLSAVSLFFVSVLGQVVPALAATSGMYFLSRVIFSLQAISVSPLVPDDYGLQRLAGWSIGAVALLLPPLENATQTIWLLYGAPSIAEFTTLIFRMIVYGCLIVAAGLFDFHRRNL